MIFYYGTPDRTVHHGDKKDTRVGKQDSRMLV